MNSFKFYNEVTSELTNEKHHFAKLSLMELAEMYEEYDGTCFDLCCSCNWKSALGLIPDFRQDFFELSKFRLRMINIIKQVKKINQLDDFESLLKNKNIIYPPKSNHLDSLYLHQEFNREYKNFF
ncbi:hypothetical protein PEDI_51550 [Persicobacter diffluens]|uniref:Uncharacterized protein n=1 Tax=Persicobacter diffluens TaxID=981 RepID=A0AAN5AQ85_9BACT|nr:hypothetical protein PEDI_51550 [Persicobacter diffluens]